MSSQVIALLDTAGIVPDFVKSAGAVDTTKLPLSAFADVQRNLPIFDEVSTWKSAASFYGEGVGEWDPRLEAAILKAASVLGIAADVERVKDYFDELNAGLAAVEKSASSSEGSPEFALVIDGSTGIYPMRTAMEVDQSLQGLQRDLLSDVQMAPTSFRKAAALLVKEASTKYPWVTIPSMVKDLGASRLIDPALAAKNIKLRRSAVSDADFALYEDAVKAAASITTAEEQEDLLTALEDLDHLCRVKVSVAQPPMACLLCKGPSTEDVTKMAATNVFVNDLPVPAFIIARLPDRVFQGAFEKSAAERFIAARDRIANGEDDSVLDFSALVASAEPETRKALLRAIVE